MYLGKIKRELVCSVKDPDLEGIKIFLIIYLDVDQSETDRYIVGVDKSLDIGIGDVVLFLVGSNSRLLTGFTEIPTDCAIAAKVESVNVKKDFII